MMLATLMLALPAAAGTVAGGPEVEWTAPAMYVSGRPYLVDVRISAPEDGTVIAGWLLTPSAFTVGGTPVGRREDTGTLRMPKGFTLEGQIDLAQFITADTKFELGYASEILGEDSVTVDVLQVAPQGLDYMSMEASELGKYRVLLETNRGNILLKFWPEIAPNHVRNFLDLSASGFYDGTTFHRVIPNFMIQGGDPTGSGSGDGPRKLKAEFNPDVHHVPGVLSMARSPDPNSASCQFFIMHGTSPNLDGQYSAFGELVLGSDVVDQIARTPTSRGDRPKDPQVIEHATVIQTPGDQ